MSSAGRGAERREDDFYESPISAVDPIIPHLGPVAGRRILDAGAGRGAIARRLLAHGADDVQAIELDPARAAVCAQYCRTFQGDYLSTELGRFDLIIGNPPFTLAARFIVRSLDLLEPGGAIAFLLRLAFICAQKRADLRRRFPCDLYPLAVRPSFMGGDTDSGEYAWFVHGPARGRRYEVLEAPESLKLFASLDGPRR